MQFQKAGGTIYSMFGCKDFIVVGIATFNVELLRISVPALARCGKNIFLIVYNDNPAQRLTARDIRRLGWRGGLRIINGDGIGKIGAWFAIADAAAGLRSNPQWLVYADDDAMMVDVNVPNVSDDVFAVIQNSAVVRGGLADLFRAMDAPREFACAVTGTDVLRPHVGMAGTLVRVRTMSELGQMVRGVADAVRKLDDEYGAAAADAVMWSWLNNFARAKNPGATPIYMDCINYILADLLATPSCGWAPARINRIVAKYDAVLSAAAALRGE